MLVGPWAHDDGEHVVGLDQADLVQRLALDSSEIIVRSVKPTEFPDARLEVLEPGVNYA
jgi:hypothetical protein